MRTRRGDFQDPLGLRLAAHVGQVGDGRPAPRDGPFGGGQGFPVGQVGADAEQRAGGQNVRRAGQRRLAGAFLGQDEGLAAVTGLQGHGQRAADRAQLAG